MKSYQTTGCALERHFEIRVIRNFHFNRFQILRSVDLVPDQIFFGVASKTYEFCLEDSILPEMGIGNLINSVNQWPLEIDFEVFKFEASL